MKVVILAGGLGTRFSEETALKPKPMIEIGGKPMLWHIMKSYSHHGITEFLICLGYRGYVIKEYFANYFLHMSDVTFDLANNRMEAHDNRVEPWRVTLVDTGHHTMTGGRIKRIAPYVGNETFLLTYGDGLSDVDIRRTVEFHREQGRWATLTASRPPGRFGQLGIDAGARVTSFEEKPEQGGWINGGFFVLQPEVFDLIEGDATVWEREPLESLAERGQLAAYKHDGFWACMDTQRDRNFLEGLWTRQQAPWNVWGG